MPKVRGELKSIMDQLSFSLLSHCSYVGLQTFIGFVDDYIPQFWRGVRISIYNLQGILLLPTFLPNSSSQSMKCPNRDSVYPWDKPLSCPVFTCNEMMKLLNLEISEGPIKPSNSSTITWKWWYMMLMIIAMTTNNALLMSLLLYHSKISGFRFSLRGDLYMDYARCHGGTE